MAAFVPSFEHDVFVSYAHRDNRTYRRDVGWVETFVNDLREALEQKLKSSQAAIWRDPRLEGSTPFPEKLPGFDGRPYFFFPFLPLFCL